MSYASTDYITFEDKPEIENFTSPNTFASSSSYYIAQYRSFYRNADGGGYVSMIHSEDFALSPPTDDVGGLVQRFSIFSNYNVDSFRNNIMVDEFTFKKNDSSMIVKKGMGFTFIPTHLSSQFYGYNSSGTLIRNSALDISKISNVVLFLVKEDGSSLRVDPNDYTYELFYSERTTDGFNKTKTLKPHYGVTIDMESVPVNVYAINIEIHFNAETANNNTYPASAYNNSWGNCYNVLRYGGFDSNSPWEFFLQDEEVGLLESIKNGIGNLLGAITDGFSNLLGAITELPSKIWSFIENGLKSLFVPSEEYIIEHKDKYDELLADRFGAIYQSGSLLIDYAESISNTSNNSGTITFPEVSVPLDESDFTFGGWEVDVVPDGFDFLVTAVKYAVDVACTFLFVNGLRKRYDNLVGGV